MGKINEINSRIRELELQKQEIESLQRENDIKKYQNYVGRCFCLSATSVAMITGVDSVSKIGDMDLVTFNCCRVFAMASRAEYLIENTFYTNLEIAFGQTDRANPTEIPSELFFQKLEEAQLGIISNLKKQ